MKRFVGLLAVAGLLAACGGTDWNSAQGASQRSALTNGAAHTASPKAGTKTGAQAAAQAAASQAAAERPYVDAMVVGLAAQQDGTTTNLLTTAQMRCAASAVIHGYGASTFADAAITPADLRDPDVSFDALPEPSYAQVTTGGGAIQRCRLGSFEGNSLSRGLDITNAATTTCFATHLDADPTARRFVLFVWVQRHPDLLAAQGLAGMIGDCVDLPNYILTEANVQLDPVTEACVVDALKQSKAQLVAMFAAHVAGDNDAETQYQESLGVTINRCRPSARTGFTVPSG